MKIQFRALHDAEEVSGADLTFSRSRAIHDAVMHHRDCILVGVFRGKASSNSSFAEILVVDISCDGVPPANTVGIRFTERFAICVNEDPKILIMVLALREGFPRLMHQNAVRPGEAPNLCLYYEPALAVARTWTAPSLLKRIQFWLEQSARGTLHAADQPVEQLFFVTPYELVLPWNFDALRADPDARFWVAKGPECPGDGGTYFLEGSSQSKALRTASVVNLELAPVVHGRVESDFGDLGQLADSLFERGIDLFSALKSEVQRRVGTGIESGMDDPNIVLLLHIPVTRTESENPSKTARRAYLITIGILKLGEAMGVVYSLTQNGICRYYKEITTEFATPPQKDEWRNQALFPMEVVSCIDRAAARFQSGIGIEGPVGTLVGAGALGSALLDLWTRSGWGEWSVIDNDHIKPHNLVRHQADASFIGASKAEAVVLRVNQVMQGATKGTAIHADASDLSNATVLQTLRTSQLVVDASTSLDYPRMISARDDVCRHVSVFVTPNGGAGVLLLEDADRKKRLRTLEAQYYRYVIAEQWGSAHLSGNLGTYWSGASCRDISMVMPYSRIVGHAATFVDHIRNLSSLREAAIRVWSRDEATGATSVYSIDVEDELHLPFDGLDLFIDVGVRNKMAALRNKNLSEETGGVLLGYYDFNVNAVVVVDALSAPRDSKASKASFERGLEGVIDAVVNAGERTAGIVGYIGEWHSHPKGYSIAPSGDDAFQLVHLALGLSMEGLPAVMLIIGDGGVCALQGAVR